MDDVLADSLELVGTGHSRDDNVRNTDPLFLCRDSPLMHNPRDPNEFGGRCEWRGVWGGSSGWAYAATGDPLSEDPLCAWQPAP
jgi:MoaA/NifB/PqqE/SkfB family radical SAM enzyme